MEKVKQLPKRAEVPVELTWDLTKIYADDQAFEVDLAAIKTQINDLTRYQNTLNEGPKAVETALTSILTVERLFEKIYIYASMKNDEDTTNAIYQGYSAQTRSLGALLGAQTAWFEPELLALPTEQLQALLAAQNLQPYHYLLSELIKQQRHVLSAEQEKLLASASDVLSVAENTFEVLDNADLKFPVVKDEAGNLVQLSHGVYSTLLESSDRTVRKEAFTKLYEVYEQFQNTFAMTLSSHVKKHNFMATIRNYPNAVTRALTSNDVPVAVYKSLLKEVHEKLPLLHRYVSLRQKLLNVDQVHMYDMYAPLVKTPGMKYSYQEAQNKALSVLSVLGEDYLSHVQEAFANRWIDVVENQGKRSGAYSSGVYDTAPYMLLNWQDTLDNLFTLVHEMGHSMHSYYTNDNQPYHYSDYSIFVAEIASTTNENLLTQSLLEEDLTKEQRAYVLNHYLDGFKGTIFRQAQFAEFELWLHEQDQAGIPLTAQAISAYYASLNEKYYGPEIVNDPQIAFEWARIPHFYYNFYVYQYATGFAAATTLAENIMYGTLEQKTAYLNFLKSGSSASPIAIMQKAGVDMTQSDYLAKAFDVFEQRLEELTKLLAD